MPKLKMTTMIDDNSNMGDKQTHADLGDCSADSLDISVNAFFVPVGNESS